VSFLKPTLGKLVLFVVIAVLLVIILYRVRFLPCQTRPVIEEPGPYTSDLCSLRQFSPGYVGINIRLTAVSWAVLAIVFLVAPYLLACTIALVRSNKMVG